jgi:hypothetical protein
MKQSEVIFPEAVLDNTVSPPSLELGTSVEMYKLG